MNFLFPFIVCTCLFALFVSGQEMDKSINHHESCEFWASVGECSKNPNYMLNYCAPACRAVEEGRFSNVPQSFYEISEQDIHGNEIDFSRFRGKVVYVVNVASECGYTAENYEILRALRRYSTQGLETVLLPCNSFGQQEPGTGVEIYNFAAEQGYHGIILKKGEVNGSKTTSLFKFLKQETGKNHISWNFDGKFIVDRNGIPHLPEKDLFEDIQYYLNQEVEL